MSLHLTFLGTGGAFTDFRVNYHNNALVWTGAGPVLIDCGGTACQAMKELGLALHDLAAVVITHCHGDHVGGLEQLVWERFYGGGPAFARTRVVAAAEVLDEVCAVLRPQIGWYTRPDREVGQDGVDRLLDGQALIPDGSGHGEGEAEVLRVGGVEFTLHATPHVSRGGGGKPAYGVRVRGEGGDLYFTSDTEFRGDVGERFPGVLFHDCTFMQRFRGTVHSHYSELVELPESVRARTVLMHHTRVPDGVDPLAAGFRGAARRFETFRVTGKRVESLGVGAAPLSGLAGRVEAEPAP